MKALNRPFVPIALIVLATGTAGWLYMKDGGTPASAGEAAKPAKSERSSNSGNAAAAADESPGKEEKAKSELRPDKVEKHGLKMLEPDSERLMASLQEQNEKRAAERAAKLVSKLGLDAGQEAKLKEYFLQSSPFTKVSGGKGEPLRMESKMESPKTSLDDFMKGLLTAEQSEGYEALKETERGKKVEASALREMASLTQAVDLRPDQRDAVYEILQNDAQNTVKGNPLDEMGSGISFSSITNVGGGDATVAVSEVLGGAIGSLGAIGAGGDAATTIEIKGDPAGGQVAPGEIMNKFKEQQQAGIDNKVNRMNGVLDQSQLDQYRASLERQPGAMIFGGH